MRTFFVLRQAPWSEIKVSIDLKFPTQHEAMEFALDRFPKSVVEIVKITEEVTMVIHGKDT
jgi:hypothetical protein